MKIITIFILTLFLSSCVSTMVGVHVEKNGDFGTYMEQTFNWPQFKW
ncbi:MAG: hypothetical protein ACFFD1_01980 [Candidatus Thorarchaeota archaeon]